MKNQEISAIFNEIADLLEIKGENPFRIGAYRRASRNIEGLAKDIAGLSMEDFLDAKALLEKTGGGIQIKDGSDLADKVIYYLSHPALSQKTGHLARKALMANVGAAKKHALFICQLLSPSIRKFDKVWN